MYTQVCEEHFYNLYSVQCTFCTGTYSSREYILWFSVAFLNMLEIP
jgi:hypothetical protein